MADSSLAARGRGNARPAWLFELREEQKFSCICFASSVPGWIQSLDGTIWNYSGAQLEIQIVAYCSGWAWGGATDGSRHGRVR
jgi:hypothetical protein